MSVLANPFPTYQPAMRIITNITNDFPAQVTTSFANQFLTGCIVRLYVPLGYGMLQANQLFGSITVVDDTNFTIDIDTRYFDAFTTPDPSSIYATQSAQSVPIGEINDILTQATLNVLPYSAV